jgi:pimeloyl-ACP methyl ester carboxylesterase
MKMVTSKDGTPIAFNQTGAGPAIILVAGALQYSAFDEWSPKLAAILAPQFTVIYYDRRGRGSSGDTQPFAVEREIEDIEALIDQTGGSASLCGISSGASLAMETAIKLGSKVRKLVMYEAPYNDDAAARQKWIEYRKQLEEALEEGRRGDAVALFMMLVGMPADHVPGMKQSPMWPLLEAVAPTLIYDHGDLLGKDASVPSETAARVTTPTLVMDGGSSFPFMHTTAVALANAMPNGQQRTLEGQTHEVTAEALAPVLAEFFSS